MQQIICSQFDRGHKVNAFISAILPSAYFEVLIFRLPACVPMAAFLRRTRYRSVSIAAVVLSARPSC